MRQILERHKKVWDKDFTHAFLFGLLLLVFSLTINYFANTYTTERASLAVTDLILSNIPVFNVDLIIALVSLLLFFVGLYWVLFHQPCKAPFILKSIALFVLIRSIFITLTHLGPFSTHLDQASSRLLTVVGLGHASDLFFSGHTGLPFLLALIFWDTRWLRYLYLGISFTLAVLVLLGHLHYSIDVFAAFFITYSIFHLCQYFFPRDWITSNS